MNQISKEYFEELKKNHYELWDWLSKNPDKEKEDWFALEQNRDKSAHAHCFACEVALLISGTESRMCDYCPLCDDTKKGCLNGLYDWWWGTYYAPSLRAKFAEQIRDLKWDKNDCLFYIENYYEGK